MSSGANLLVRGGALLLVPGLVHRAALLLVGGGALGLVAGLIRGAALLLVAGAAGWKTTMKYIYKTRTN